MAQPIKAVAGETSQADLPEAKREVVSEAANEFVFGVVGHIGSGTSEVARSFKELLERQKSPFQTKILKASEVIETWAKGGGLPHPDRAGSRTIDSATTWQDLGDEMRGKTKDHSAVAKGLIGGIRNARAAACSVAAVDGEPVMPDGSPRAYILDALRHPAEVNLLRHLYQEAFVLIAVVCDQDVREARLNRKFDNPGHDKLSEFMKRDEKDNSTHGQQVSKAFQMADFYVDNTPDRFARDDSNVRTLPQEPSRTIRTEKQRPFEPVAGWEYFVY